MEFARATETKPQAEGLMGFPVTEFRPGGETIRLSAFGRVRYGGLYPGIDAVFHGRKGRMEYDFEVAAGARPERIALRLPVDAEAEIEDDGALRVTWAGSVYRQKAPEAWQVEPDGKRKSVAVRFRLSGEEVGFLVGAYDSKRPLLIDPTLDFSTHLAKGNAIRLALDGAENIYVAMISYGPLVPQTTIGLPQVSGNQLWIAKFDPTGTNLLYLTALSAGLGFEGVARILVNAAQEAVVVGVTQSFNMPLVNPVPGSIRTTSSTGGFALRLSSDGQRLLHSTHLAGNYVDSRIYDAALDAAGNLYIAAGGRADFGATVSLGQFGTFGDVALCLKLGPNGGAYLMAAAVRSGPAFTTTHQMRSVTVDSTGRVLWLLETNGSGVAPVGGGAQKTSSGLQGIIIEWNAAGTEPVLVTSPFPATDWFPRRIRVGPDQSILLAGVTVNQSTLPAGEAMLGDPSGRGAFFVRLSRDTKRLLLRNILDFGIREMGVDRSGNLILAGEANNAAIFDPYQTNNAGASDLFIRKYGPDWQRVIYGTYFGGIQEEELLGMEIDSQGRVLLAGTTRSPDYPTVASRIPGPVVALAEQTVFLTRLRDQTPGILHTFTSTPTGVSITVDRTWYTTPAVFAWQPGSQHEVLIDTLAAVPGAGPTDYYFQNGAWEDGSPLVRTIVAGSAPREFRFSYTRKDCFYSVSPTYFRVGTFRTAVITNVTTAGPCGWDPISEVPWMGYESYRNPGSATLVMRVDSSPDGASRRGVFRVRGIPVTVDQGGVPPTADRLSITSNGPDPRQYLLTASFSDGDGEQDLTILNILINSALDGRQACYMAFDSGANIMYLVPDNGEGLLATGLGSNTPISNSQCSVQNVGVERLGTEVRVTALVRFDARFQADKLVYLAARDRSGGNSGWTTRGRIRLSEPTPENQRPQVLDFFIPNAQRFQMFYRDGVAATNVTAAQLLVNTALDGRRACYIGYDRAANVAYLFNDLGTELLPGVVLGQTGSVSNGQCTLDGGASTRTISGRDLTIDLALTLKAEFRGLMLVYGGIQTTSPGLSNSGWRALAVLNRTQ
ncbi:MAG: hypothetical protein NTV52_21290 [Acidobacteria bacterium]|nr:hypothetical protein [Acidobacteriota bacterium]